MGTDTQERYSEWVGRRQRRPWSPGAPVVEPAVVEAEALEPGSWERQVVAELVGDLGGLRGRVTAHPPSGVAVGGPFELRRTSIGILFYL